MIYDIPGQIKTAKLIFQIIGWVSTVTYSMLTLFSLIWLIVTSSFIPVQYLGFASISAFVVFVFFALAIGWSIFLIRIGNAVGKRKTWARIAGIVAGSLWCLYAIINIITPNVHLILIPNISN